MTRKRVADDPSRTVVRVGTGSISHLVAVKSRRGYLPDGGVDPAWVEKHTGRSGNAPEPGSLHGPHPGYVDHTDSDTEQYGFGGPFEPWEADSRALVGILWGFRNSGHMATDPGVRAPLRHALFRRLHTRVGSGDNENLIGDLRAILDAHDPTVTPGAPGASYLSEDQTRAAEAAERQHCLDHGIPMAGQEPADAIATQILHSRWRVAFETYAQAKALTDAARDMEESGLDGWYEAADRLRERAEDLTGKPAAMERDQPHRTRAAKAAEGQAGRA